jgi:group II intron reverse transcriptase/maturase
MSLRRELHQKSAKAERPNQGRGEASSPGASGESPTAASGIESSGNDHRMMERVVERTNTQAALKRVKQNKGGPGVDGMTVKELEAELVETWETTREQLLAGSYQPRPVKRQEIPKAGGGVRELGIPCVLDRMIQQAILQVLQPIFDPTFSEHSHGFRPGRRAHDAVCAAQRYIQSGKQWVVDVDLEKFFDRVNHDVLMGKLEKRICDKRMLGLIRRYLEAGVMVEGIVAERTKGTPQGGPLSPLLANVLLDEVDKELEKRGHAFARYADDCNVYVGSERAGQRVLQALRGLYARLKLKVNESKSAVARPWERKFLGYTFCDDGGTIKRLVSPQSLKAMKDEIRRRTSRVGGRSLEEVIEALRSFLTGWKQYYCLDENPKALGRLDGWIRHRLRAIQLKQWKNGPTIYRELRRRGLSPAKARGVAGNSRRWWRTSSRDLNIALPNTLFARVPLLGS